MKVKITNKIYKNKKEEKQLTLGECLLSVGGPVDGGLLTSEGGWLFSFLLSLCIGPSDKKSGRLFEAPTSPDDGRSKGNDSGKSNGNTAGGWLPPSFPLSLSLWLDVRSKGISAVGCLFIFQCSLLGLK